MQHAHDTNKKDRAQRQNRRKKFKGKQGEQILNSGNNTGDIQFNKLTEEQIAVAREKIRNDYLKNRWKTRFLYGVILVIVSFLVFISLAPLVLSLF